MAFADYANYDGHGLADLVRKGEAAPSELVGRPSSASNGTTAY